MEGRAGHRRLIPAPPRPDSFGSSAVMSPPGAECLSGARGAFDDLVAAGVDPACARARVAAGVAVAVARHLGVVLPPLALVGEWGPAVAVEVAPSQASPQLVGMAHGALLDPAGRRSSGSFYTAPEVAAAVVGWALEGRAGERPVVCDPAVGGGAFLLAAADALAGDGRPRAAVVNECLVGADIDPVAAAVAQAALALWCGGEAVPRVVIGDALALEPEDWPATPDVVVGNPPFLNQLGRRTARRRDEAVAVRRRLGAAVTGYADSAVLFLVMATGLVGPGGTVALILPESFLATRDGRAARSAVLADARLETLWVPSVSLFGAAAVRICVPVLRRGASRRGALRIWGNMPPRLVAEAEIDAGALAAEPTWSHLLSAGSEIPGVSLEDHGVLGQWGGVSADFRQHYYGVAPFMVDDPAGDLDDERFPPLVTVGMVDPAVCHWGRRRTRHHRLAWDAPRVELARLESESELGPWARSRLVPKVVVATQTRVVEAAVDVKGRWLPSTPLISVVAPPERLWHIAAALSSPPVTAWALHRWAGTALSAGGLKMSAAQVRAVPVPRPGPHWDEAAAHLRRAGQATDEAVRRHWLLAAAAESTLAYGVDDPALLGWWQARLPNRRRDGR